MTFIYNLFNQFWNCDNAKESSRRIVWSQLTIISKVMILFFPSSVQPVSAWNVCWQWRHRGFCSQSAGESGHPSAQHTTVGGRHRGRLSNDITRAKVLLLCVECNPLLASPHCLCVLIADKWRRETGVQRATHCLPLWRSLWQCEADWWQLRESCTASHRGTYTV